VRDKLDDSVTQPDTTATLDPDFPMTAICEIETTLAGYIHNHEYKLYLKFDDGSAAPILGPHFFRVEDD